MTISEVGVRLVKNDSSLYLSLFKNDPSLILIIWPNSLYPESQRRIGGKKKKEEEKIEDEGRKRIYSRLTEE